MKISDSEYLYKIGTKEYRMKPLVMGQINQLINLLKDVRIPVEVTAVDLIYLLGDKLTEAIAIILITDVPLKDKNVQEVCDEIRFELSPELTLEIIEDFFDCTPVSSILERMGKTVEKIGAKIGKQTG